MINSEDKKEMEEIVKDAVNEALESNKQQITREKIISEKDTAKRQRLIAENIDLFKEVQ